MYIYVYRYIHIQGLESGVFIPSTMSWLAALPKRSVIDNKYQVMVYLKSNALLHYETCHLRGHVLIQGFIVT